MKYIIHYLFLSFLILGCNKEKGKTVSITGKVINTVTGLPIDSAMVGISDGIGGSSIITFGPTFGDNKASAITDANGEFSCNFNTEFNPYISAYKKGYKEYKYAQSGAAFSAMPLTREKKQNVVLELIGQSFFCPTFICRGNNCDSLILRFLPYSNSKYNSPECNSSGKNTCRCNMCFDGKPFNYCDGNILQSIYGDTYLRFKMDIKRNNQWTQKIDSVLLKSMETYSDTIYY